MMRPKINTELLIYGGFVLVQIETYLCLYLCYFLSLHPLQKVVKVLDTNLLDSVEDIGIYKVLQCSEPLQVLEQWYNCSRARAQGVTW